jgi:hypothetical protein
MKNAQNGIFWSENQKYLKNIVFLYHGLLRKAKKEYILKRV